MVKTWHPTIEAREVYGTKRENWNDKNPSVTLILEVDEDDIDDFIDYFCEFRPYYPITCPYNLRGTSIELLPVESRYSADSSQPGLQEYITRINPVLFQVTYTSDPRQRFILYGLTGTDEAQGVLLVEYVTIVTETLQLDFTDYEWEDGTPLSSSDLAPGKLYRTYKIVQVWEKVELTSDLETALFETSGTVNQNNVQFMMCCDKVFDPEQVLFAVEEVTPSIQAASQITPGTDVQLYTLRLSYTCRTGESTWNKMWRTKQQSGQDDSGWFRIRHKKTSVFGTTPDAYLFELSSGWDMFVLNPP